MFNSIPQKGYRIPQRSIRQTNSATRGFNARAYGIAYRIGDSSDLKDILRIRVSAFFNSPKREVFSLKSK